MKAVEETFRSGRKIVNGGGYHPGTRRRSSRRMMLKPYFTFQISVHLKAKQPKKKKEKRKIQ